MCGHLSFLSVLPLQLDKSCRRNHYIYHSTDYEAMSLSIHSDGAPWYQAMASRRNSRDM